MRPRPARKNAGLDLATSRDGFDLGGFASRADVRVVDAVEGPQRPLPHPKQGSPGHAINAGAVKSRTDSHVKRPVYRRSVRADSVSVGWAFQPLMIDAIPIEIRA